MEQWPLTAEKLQAAEDLVMEQLAAGQIGPFNSPWDTTIFVHLVELEKHYSES